MQENIHRPIEESVGFTEKEKEQFNRKFITSGIALILLIILLFILSNTEGIGGAFIGVNVLCIIFIGILSIYYFIFSRKDAFKQRFLINEKGIFKTHINYTKGTESQEHIPYKNIKKIIINNYAAPYQGKKSNKVIYHLGAFMFIHHTEGSYYLYVFEADQYYNFIERFLDKNCLLYKSDKNLEKFFIQKDLDKIDFSQLPIERWDNQGDPPTFEKGWDHDPYEAYREK